MAHDLVSVILPVYNRESTIKRAIDSVLSQTYANIELIVVDDASTDHTIDLVKSYEDSRIKLICLKERGGANRARNIGIENSEGKYIAFQDSDDEWRRNKLALQITFMQTEGFSVCFSPYYLHEKEKVRVIPVDYQSNESYHNGLKDILRYGNVVGTPTLVFDREVLFLLNGVVFDETLPRFQDYELMIRLSQIVNIGYIEEPLVDAYLCNTENNIAKNKLYFYEAVGKIFKKHQNFLDIDSFVKPQIIKNSENEEISALLQGIEIIQNIVGMELIDMRSEVITYLYDRLKYKDLILKKLFKAALSSLYDKKFIVYGAGAIANEFYGKISKSGIKPDSFVVTSLRENDSEEIDGIPVCAAEDYLQKDVLVVICAALENQKDILDNLFRCGYSNICIYYDFEQGE